MVTEGLVPQSHGNHTRSVEDEFILNESHSRGCLVPLQCLHTSSAPLLPVCLLGLLTIFANCHFCACCVDAVTPNYL